MKRMIILLFLCMACATSRNAVEPWTIDEPVALRKIQKVAVMLNGKEATTCSMPALKATIRELVSRNFNVISDDNLAKRSFSIFVDPMDSERIGRIFDALDIDGLWLLEVKECDVETGSSFAYSIMDRKGRTLAYYECHQDAKVVSNSNTSYNYISGEQKTVTHATYLNAGSAESLAAQAVTQYVQSLRNP